MRIIRAILALLFSFAAMAVLFEMAAVNHWGPFSVRLPLFVLVPWAYASGPKNRWVAALAILSLTGIFGAFLSLVTPSLRSDLSFYLFNGLGGVGFVSLAMAVAAQAWLTLMGWRADRARLRAQSRGRLERLSGGF